MNMTLDSSMPDAVGSALADEKRRELRELAQLELAKMSAEMVRQKGLLNHAQAGLLLGVSVKRIGELVRLGKLSRFDFLGRTYVSVCEVRERYQQDLKAGRPKQGLAQRAVASVKAALKTDAAQAKLGGYAGPYEKAKLKQKRKKKP